MDTHYTKEYLDKLYKDTGDIFRNKYTFLSDEIFCLAPYDDSISEKWGKAIYEVMKAIYKRKNYDYINKDICKLYDTEMNLIAKIKFITDINPIS